MQVDLSKMSYEEIKTWYFIATSKPLIEYGQTLNNIGDSLKNYLEYGYPPGSFLTHLLYGDIYRSYQSADRWSKDYLSNIIGFIVNNLPQECYGSKDKVNAWIKSSGMKNNQYVVLPVYYKIMNTQGSQDDNSIFE